MKSLIGRLLYLIDNHTGLLFKQMSFFLVDLTTGEKAFICKLPVGKKTEIQSRFRLVSRLKRLEPKCVGKLSKDEFVVCVLGRIWLLDLNVKAISVLQEIRNGFSQVINFCSDGTNVYWGDYGVNKLHDEVNIYSLTRQHELSTIYTFPSGSVRHIHNIVFDNINNRYWILVGDNEVEAGIYVVNKDWSVIKPYRIGQQKYRAVVAFPYNNGLIYATDSVEAENHIRYISNMGEEKLLATLNGSCIYGCETKDNYLFSTTVEPHEGGGKLSLIFEKLGGGIKSRYVTIMAVSKKDLSVSKIASFKKDWWPMKIFQYGRCIFAGGQKELATAWCSPVACKKFDGKTIKIEL